ncbi:short-chain dehydrogenase/reductase [Tothia fuscella]|uniref:Short-chain dehydrogenase/reductase n=1 Tax=Tothia fuscella TaxID=1048955 RepID=A0A9P4NM47_9PEZI|nr:short-chain dehydrogenase/reductase [Tothia fuscella]
MVAISEIRGQLHKLSEIGPNLVGVFVGGTSGIGESTAREFVRYANAPRVYLVGRSREQAEKLVEEFKDINKEAQTTFLQSDVSLLRNVDEVCKEIRGKESKVNLLVLSAGIMTMSGRDETDEGLDKKVSLHCYSRLRFTANLLPLLRAASTSQPPLSRIISVLGAGYEGALDTSDLSLRKPGAYSLSSAANHAISMTSLSFDHLAKDAANKDVAFVHSNPGGVQTNLGRNLGGVMQKLLAVGAVLLKPTGLIVPVKESGERHAWAGTSGAFGSGAILVGPKGEKTTSKVFEGLRRDGKGEVVWRHMEEVFRQVEGQGAKYIGEDDGHR